MQQEERERLKTLGNVMLWTFTLASTPGRDRCGACRVGGRAFASRVVVSADFDVFRSVRKVDLVA